jgi:PAS domain S-box-containing protein
MSKKKILIVEDDGIVAMDLQFTLQRSGYNVVGHAPSGKEAIKLLGEAQPDLVLMDIRLRGILDGIQTSHKIRSQLDVPIVYLTAHADEDTLGRAQETEPYGYLVKPFQDEELRATVQMALYKHNMEKKLRESEEKYRTLSETMAQGVVYQDRDGAIIYANPAAERILGLTIDQMQGRTSTDPLWQAVKEDGSDFPGGEHPAMVALATGEPVKDIIMGVFNRALDGYLWVSINAVPLFKKNENTPHQVYATFSDITERRQMEIALRESEEKLRNVISQSSDGIMLIGEGGLIIEWNRKCEEITGLERSEAFNRPVWEVQDYVSTEPSSVTQLEQSKVTILDSLKTGQAPWFNQLLETEIQRPDGDIRVTQSITFPILTGRGYMVGSIMRDVTERKKVEEALRNSESRLRSLIDSMPVIVFIYQDGQVVYVNPAAEAVTGYRSDDIMRDGFWDIMEAASIAEAKERERASADADNDMLPYYETSILTKSGENKWLHISLIPMEYEGRSALLGTALNVTERRLAEQQRVELRMEKERVRILSNFIEKASHEFRTPLSIINTSTYLLRNISDPERREGYLCRIEEQSDNLTKLIGDLIMLSELDSGRQLAFETVDLNRFVHDINSTIESKANMSNHRAVVELCKESVPIRGNLKSLRQAIINIVDNAARFTSDGGIITVRSSVSDGFALLEIIDTGEGISENNLARVFERFYRIDEIGTTRGFGLGLPIAKAIIEQHQGRIEIESEVGVGSTVRVLLPLYRYDSSESTQSEE